MHNISPDNQRIAKNTLLLYIRMFLTMAISLYTSRIILNALGINDYGIYNIVGGIVTCLSFINASLTSASTRFSSLSISKNNPEDRYKTFITNFNLHLICAGIIFIVLESIGIWFLNNYLVIPQDRILAANYIYQFSIFTCLTSIITVPFSSTIIAYEKMSIYAYLAIIEVIMKLIIAVGLQNYENDRLILYGALLMLVSFITAFFNYSYCHKHYSECQNLHLSLDKTRVKSISTYIGWSMYSNLSHISYLQGLNILLNLFFGPSINAARAIAVNVQNTIMGFTTNFQMALNPQIIKNYASNSKDALMKLVYRSVRFSFYLLACLIIPIILTIDTLLKSWLGIVPEYTEIFCQLILCVSFINALSNPLMVLIQANGNLKKNSLYTGNCLLLILPTSYLLLKMGFSPPIVFIVNIFFYILAIIIRINIIKTFMIFDERFFFLTCIGKPLLVISIPTFILLFINNHLPRNIFYILLFDTFGMILLSIFIYQLGLEKVEKAFINDKINFIVNKI